MALALALDRKTWMSVTDIVLLIGAIYLITKSNGTILIIGLILLVLGLLLTKRIKKTIGKGRYNVPSSPYTSSE